MKIKKAADYPAFLKKILQLNYRVFSASEVVLNPNDIAFI